MKPNRILLLSVMFALTLYTFGQERKAVLPESKIDNSLDSTVINYKKQQRSITYGSVNVEGNTINYQAVAGSLVFRNSTDTPIISISYIAYFKRDEKDATKRTITFIYN